MSELSQVERVVRILQRLSLRGEITVSELFAYFEQQVPKRTLQRDLIALSSANIPLSTRKGRGKELIWYLDRSLLRFIPETIGNQELLASYFLERLSVITKGTQLERSIQSLLKKTRQLISPEIFASLEGPEPSRGLFGVTYTGYIDYGPHSETLECVLNAASHRRRCEFHYRRPGNDPVSVFEADPYMIVFHKGALYVVAKVTAHDSYILLAVQRIIKVRPTETKFVRDRSFNLETFKKNRFGIFGHPTLKPQKVILRFTPDIAETVAERVWHPTQTLKRHKDGSLTLSMEVVISDELKGWIASWRGYVRVVAPVTLAGEFRRVISSNGNRRRKMMRNDFSAWSRWSDRNGLKRIQFPGVYVIAVSGGNIANKPFSWRKEIIYVGMTNAKGGLKSRLQQFESKIKGGDGHGGAKRVRFKYPNYPRLAPRLYVSVCPRECDVESNLPADLRVMGDVEKHEYECFATFVEKFKQLPEFNDKKRSPKK